MSKKDILKLMVGFRKFRDKYFNQENSLYHKLATNGQSPKTLIIGCSDSRADPAIIASASPGELFIVRNVANLVPPYEQGGGRHGVSSAIEFAVMNLQVESIIVLGHRQCGGIRALMLNHDLNQNEFVNRWMNIAKDAKIRVLKNYPNSSEEELCRHGELEAIIVSLDNLKTFPFVAEAIKTRNLTLMGIYFDLELGQLLGYDEESQSFKNIEL